MTEIEIKSLQAKLELSNEIRNIDKMIIYYVQNTAKELLKNILYPKYYTKENETIEFTIEEFEALKKGLAKLESDDGFKKLTSSFNENYLIPKEEKLKILYML